MESLFIGQAYIDITFLVDHLPTGDEKTVAEDYAVAFGGNAVTAAFTCARLGFRPDLLCVLGDDWIGRMFLDMADRYRVSIHARKVRASALSFVMPRGTKRAIVRCRDDHYLHPFPQLSLDRCQLLHIDGHQADAALHYARTCRQAGILTSMDGGTVRENTDAVLDNIDVAVVSEDFCRVRDERPMETIRYLMRKGVKVAGVTLGSEGMIWQEAGAEPAHLPALDVPTAQVVDTNGAGDVFHGAYCASWLMDRRKPWREHFLYARAASAHAIQNLGNEASVPEPADVERATARFPARPLNETLLA